MDRVWFVWGVLWVLCVVYGCARPPQGALQRDAHVSQGGALGGGLWSGRSARSGQRLEPPAARMSCVFGVAQGPAQAAEPMRGAESAAADLGHTLGAAQGLERSAGRGWGAEPRGAAQGLEQSAGPGWGAEPRGTAGLGQSTELSAEHTQGLNGCEDPFGALPDLGHYAPGDPELWVMRSHHGPIPPSLEIFLQAWRACPEPIPRPPWLVRGLERLCRGEDAEACVLWAQVEAAQVRDERGGAFFESGRAIGDTGRASKVEPLKMEGGAPMMR